MSHSEQDELLKLKETTEQIAEEIKSMNEELFDKQEEIVDMKKYFWENCNEFDEFGYEHFTNRQMIQTEINMAAEKMHKRQVYEKMVKSPYFACVDFKYDGEEDDESYYIGLASFTTRKSYLPLVFDWRAPIAGLFYDYDKGPAKFMAPQGESTGQITHKLQYHIVNGKMEYFFENDMKIDDDILMRELGTNANARLKTIVATIQREQNAIIRNEKDRILVVQGAAGSGKTSVAMHRIAYLLYHKRRELNSNNVMILTPNPIFSDYISGILPELGEETIVEMSFDEYAEKELEGIVEFEEHFTQTEYLLREAADSEFAQAKREVMAYKQSDSFLKALYTFVLEMEDYAVEWRDLTYRGIACTIEEQQNLFYNKFPDIPVLMRLETIAEYLIGETEAREGKDMDPIRAELIRDRFIAMYRTRDIKQLYLEFLKELEDYGEPANYSEVSSNAIFPYEDVFPLVYLKLLVFGNGTHRSIKHLVIDEMQDYTRVQYAIIKELFNCPMTILGDRQQVSELEHSKVLEMLPEVLGKHIKLLELKKSYRSTAEIGSFCGKLINDSTTEFFDRHGTAPVIEKSSGIAETAKKIAADISVKRNDFSTIAVICKTQREADLLHEEISKYIEAALFNTDTYEFHTGVVVTPFYLAKGLEFDAVYVSDVNSETFSTADDRQILYIACTRALHELTLYYSGEKSRILPE